MRIKDIDSLPEGMLKDQVKDQINDSDQSRNKRRDFEHALQVEAKKYMMLQYPELEKKFFAIPNGGARDAATGAKLKKEGVLAGVWDLFLAVPRAEYGGCWIETKWGRNRLTKTQKAFRKANKGDYNFFVYRNMDEFIAEIKKYLNI